MTENKRAREWYLLFHDRNEGLNLIKKKPSLAHHLNISSHVQVHVIEFSEVERLEKEVEAWNKMYAAEHNDREEAEICNALFKSNILKVDAENTELKSKLQALESELKTTTDNAMLAGKLAAEEITDLTRLSDGQSRQYEQTRQKLSNCEESERELTKEYYANLKALSDENAELKGQKQIIEQMADSAIKALKAENELMRGALDSIKVINSAIADETHDFKATVEFMRNRAEESLAKCAKGEKA